MPDHPPDGGRPAAPSLARTAPTPEVVALRAAVAMFFNRPDAQGRPLGSARWGIYVFYDYDGEPLYVGQTAATFRDRIGRHLTNQRTDAVAMNVLDPFEVAEIEVWPLALEGRDKPAVRAALNDAEFSVFQQVRRASRFGAVLNEKIQRGSLVALPPSHRGVVVPPEQRAMREHGDTRIARRAATIAALARVIGERKVSVGLRQTLLTQARRLERLARERVEDFGLTPGQNVVGEGPDEGENEE